MRKTKAEPNDSGSSVEKLAGQFNRTLDAFFGPNVTRQHRELEQRVEEHLKNGAKFVPRARRSR